MASTKRVTLPDGTVLTLPADLSVEEIKASLSSSGQANVDTATYTVDANTGDIVFRAPAGGRKG